MAFQFGTVGALGPAIGEASRADAAAVGLLVGLYLSPGLLFALPGGAIARTFTGATRGCHSPAVGDR